MIPARKSLYERADGDRRQEKGRGKGLETAVLSKCMRMPYKDETLMMLNHGLILRLSVMHVKPAGTFRHGQ
ncbi:hypothetical protein MLD38_038775 [Melastoma candidum]|uniref:Uncharacterized protein n=1 Tax=Melastoma candidum TaxID=119954 RepID=A0ACB9L104_9MYRT|nr:hypothetical protein MLD38_038775 [Melastoma candidum]